MDAALVFDTEALEADLAFELGDLATDAGLRTAVVISLFSDALAEADDELPAGETWRRGWWAERLDAPGTDRFGSKLWLLVRQKQTEEVRLRAIEYAQASLAWLIADKVAARVEVMAQWRSRGVLALAVRIVRGDGSEAVYNFSGVWDSEQNRSLNAV